MSENRLQWVAIICTVIGLLASVYYNAKILTAARMQSEMSSYLHLNERYHKILFSLMEEDPKIFSRTSDMTKSQKYHIYEMFEVFALVTTLEDHYKEIDSDAWPIWHKRMSFLLQKPAIQHAWQCRMDYAEALYVPEFIAYMENLAKLQINDEKL